MSDYGLIDSHLYVNLFPFKSMNPTADVFFPNWKTFKKKHNSNNGIKSIGFHLMSANFILMHVPKSVRKTTVSHHFRAPKYIKMKKKQLVLL